MKKIVCLFGVLIPSIVFAWPEAVQMTVTGVTTSTVPVSATSQQLSAYINQIQIIVLPAGKTCVVEISTASTGPMGSRVIGTIAAATGTNTVIPYVQGMTNGVAVEWFRKELLASDQLVISAHTATDTTPTTVKAIAVIERQP